MDEKLSYSARLEIDYPEQRNRLSVLLRPIFILPILLVLVLIAGGTSHGNGFDPAQWQEVSQFLGEAGVDPEVLGDLDQWAAKESASPSHAGAYGGGTDITTGLFLATVLLLLFRRRYPRWWFDFLLELNRFSARVCAYGLLLTDRYPSTEDRQSVALDLDYPDASQLNRWMPLGKWLFAIPHYVVLAILGVGVILGTFVAWFSILLTGKYPRPIFDYVVGVGRWALRVEAYALLLLTDEYPPFSLKGPAVEIAGEAR